VGRPHPAFVQNQIAAPSYQFGSTGGGRYRPHHGMDIANPFGTPVRAATTGEVVHAGLDDPDVLGPYPNFYGNAVVIKLDRRLTVAGGEMDVYLLYGHLSEVTVQKGQRVQPDDIVGMVGMTGIAIGPHLHVEVRVGANTYEASVNPYLWVEPPPGAGAVAVRLLSADGRTWPNARVTLARFEGNLATWARVLEAYPDNESINPDPAFGETSAMEGVPAGVYYLVAVVNGERVAAEVTVEAGKTTFVEMRTQQ
jgi:murein DD-endopeptidase MepM/ murein hydrolase activator NlpD